MWVKQKQESQQIKTKCLMHAVTVTYDVIVSPTRALPTISDHDGMMDRANPAVCWRLKCSWIESDACHCRSTSILALQNISNIASSNRVVC